MITVDYNIKWEQDNSFSSNGLFSSRWICTVIATTESYPGLSGGSSFEAPRDDRFDRFEYHVSAARKESREDLVLKIHKQKREEGRDKEILALLSSEEVEI